MELLLYFQAFQYVPQPVIQQAPPVQAAAQPQAQAADANNPTMLGEVLASMVRSLAAGQAMQEVAATSDPQPVKEVKTVSEQPAVNAVPSQSIYPPDAVITTTTTVDTTKAAAKSVAEAERDSRETFFDIENRKALIDTFIYRVLLYDDKMKLIFNLKGGQKNELLLNLIFPDYPDGNGGADENSVKEKETENSVSLSGCSYTPVMVPLVGVEPTRYRYKCN